MKDPLGCGRILAGLALAAAVMLAARDAAADWWLSADKFHASAHGQASCGDCHSPDPGHPDPRRVVQSAGGPFDAEGCYACHGSVRDGLSRSRHGGRDISDPQAHADCRRCHDPHASATAAARQNGFDPDRPVGDQCAVCHAAQKELPPLSAEDAACMECHRRPQPANPAEAARIERFCLDCHGSAGSPRQALTGERVPRIDRAAGRPGAHGSLACTDCHSRAAAYEHDRQAVTACTQCHSRHDEKAAHDAHVAVSCEACHLMGGSPVKAAGTPAVEWRASRDLAAPLAAHDLVDFGDRAGCRRCHFAGNTLGAAAMVLPAKSIICLPCHAATLTAADPISWISLGVLAAGLVLGGIFVLGGRPGGRAAGHAAGGARPAFGAIRAVFRDVLLQRRLFRRSPKRWLIHGLLFYPMLLRTLWGVFALAASLAAPDWPPVRILLDKNHPAAEAVFDVTGLLLLAGVGLIARRGAGSLRGSPVEGLPARDIPALVAIALIVVVGFVLEGLRMAMTGAGSPAAFVGFALAALFRGAAGLTEIYGYVWYAHALAVGALVAYLPFSRLKHMILSPAVLAMNAWDRGR
jgi:nitrate reductase gamma subunit